MLRKARDAGIGAFAGAGMFIATFGFSEFTASVIQSARDAWGSIKNFFNPGGCSSTSSSSVTYSQAAQNATQNPQSREVVLGDYLGVSNPLSYQNVAEMRGATYYQMPQSQWTQWASQYGKNAMYELNYAFLDQQIAQNKIFTLAANPYTADPSKSFGKEVAYLLSQGYQIFEDGVLWIMTRL